MAERVELAREPALPATAQWRGDGIAITPLGAFARWSLRLPPAKAAQLQEVAGFPMAIEMNRGATTGDKFVARLGPDEWLLCAPVNDAAELEHAMAAELEGYPHALVDIGHRYAALAIEGPRAPVLLASGCPLDLHPAAFVAGTATRTLLGKSEITLWRQSEALVYRIECARSFAPYVCAFLREAAREFT